MEEILRFNNVSKFFPGVVANDKVTLAIEKGEIHTLLGENGAGKSTLMNVLYGLYKADEGEIFFEGKKVDISMPNDAIRLGIGMIHQHFMLIPNFTVWENIALGQKTAKSPILDVNIVKEKIKKLQEQFQVEIDLNSPVEALSVGIQQKVEILKALYRGSKLLILDEPTSVLTPAESEELFVMLRQLTAKGCTIIFISHKLKEVMSISDRVSVLRDGKLIKTLPISECSPEIMSALMVGREVSLAIELEKNTPESVLLEIDNISLSGKSKHNSLKNISLSVRGGEILGIAGIDGNGQDELAEVICGLQKADNGKIVFCGEDVTRYNVRTRSLLNFSYVPADRRNVGLAMEFKIFENAIMTKYFKKPFANGFMLNFKAIKEYATGLVNKYAVKAPSTDVFIKNLSGGNQQKVVLAREIERSPKILLIVQPTWGLDIGACRFVYNKIMEERKKGVAILLISTDLEEVRTLSDRLAVIYEGSIMGEVDPKTAKVEEIGLMMTGVKLGENSKSTA